MDILNEEEKNLANEIKKLEEEKQLISNKLRKLINRQKVKKYKEREKYVGKCYKLKDDDKYYKVLSNYSENDTRLTCLTFNLNDNIYHSALKNIDNNIFFYDYPNIYLDMTMFEVDYVFAFGYSDFFDKVIEITTEQFEAAQQEMINKFIRETKEISYRIKKLAENDYKRLYE